MVTTKVIDYNDSDIIEDPDQPEQQEKTKPSLENLPIEKLHALRGGILESLTEKGCNKGRLEAGLKEIDEILQERANSQTQLEINVRAITRILESSADTPRSKDPTAEETQEIDPESLE